MAKHLLNNKPWDFFMMVEMGPDRIHHGFWKYFDTRHRKHEPGSDYRDAVLDYYRYLDRELSEMLALADDNTATIIVSDHGAQAMQGGVCINEWLLQEGYLALLEKPPGIVSLARARIDWSRTHCWGEGGYYARIFFNLKGREPQGVVSPQNYEALRSEIARKLEAMGDERGNPLGTRVLSAHPGPAPLYIEWSDGNGERLRARARGMRVAPTGELLVPDSLTGDLLAFTRNADGSLANRRVWAAIPGEMPDGISLDAEGAVWVASHHQVLRVREGGEVTDVVDMGATRATACTLGGADGRPLLITASDTHDRAEIRAKGPSGSVFTVRVPVAGAGLPSVYGAAP